MKYIVMECHEGFAVLMDEESRFVNAANFHYKVGQTVTDPMLMQDGEKETKRITFHVCRFVAAAACIAAIFTAGSLYYSRNLKPNSTILISSDANIRMDLNKKGKVITLRSDDLLGKEILKEYSGKGKDMVSAANDIIEIEKDKGYISDGDTIDMYISSENSDAYSTYKADLENGIANVKVNVKGIDASKPAEKHEPEKPDPKKPDPAKDSKEPAAPKPPVGDEKAPEPPASSSGTLSVPNPPSPPSDGSKPATKEDPPAPPDQPEVPEPPKDAEKPDTEIAEPPKPSDGSELPVPNVVKPKHEPKLTALVGTPVALKKLESPEILSTDIVPEADDEPKLPAPVSTPEAINEPAPPEPIPPEILTADIDPEANDEPKTIHSEEAPASPQILP